MQPVYFDQFTNKNHTSLARLITRIFDYVESILIIRIDLGYRREVIDRVTLKIIQEHRARLLDNRRQNEIFSHLRGYSWHIDSGEFADDVGAQGLHHQFLFMFDAAARAQEADIGRQIAHYFETVISQGWGYSCVSNDLSIAEVGFLGSQFIHRYDTELRNQLLEHVAGEMTQPASFPGLRSELSESGRFRSFSRSRVWKPLPRHAPRR